MTGDSDRTATKGERRGRDETRLTGLWREVLLLACWLVGLLIKPINRGYSQRVRGVVGRRGAKENQSMDCEQGMEARKRPKEGGTCPGRISQSQREEDVLLLSGQSNPTRHRQRSCGLLCIIPVDRVSGEVTEW